MKDNDVGTFFDTLTDGYTATIERCFPRYREMLWALLNYLPQGRSFESILELGCGTGNLSESGLFVITNHPLEVNTRLRLLLDLSNSPLTLTGDVRWMNSSPRVGRSPGMGVQLQPPTGQYAEYVRTLG